MQLPPPVWPTTTTTTTPAPTPEPTPAPTPAPSPEPKLIGPGCCRRLKDGIARGWKTGILMSWKNGTRTECMQRCAEHPACNAFAPSGCSSSSDQICGEGCHIYKTDTSEGEISSDTCYDTNGFVSITSNTFCYA